jgi:hypothetical protein
MAACCPLRYQSSRPASALQYHTMGGMPFGRGGPGAMGGDDGDEKGWRRAEKKESQKAAKARRAQEVGAWLAGLAWWWDGWSVVVDAGAWGFPAPFQPPL